MTKAEASVESLRGPDGGIRPGWATAFAAMFALLGPYRHGHEPMLDGAEAADPPVRRFA